MISKKLFIIFCILWTIIGLSIGIITNNYLPEAEEYTISDLEYQYACMNGCLNMEKIILREFDYSNETQREYIILCSNNCIESFIPKEE